MVFGAAFFSRSSSRKASTSFTDTATNAVASIGQAIPKHFTNDMTSSR